MTDDTNVVPFGPRRKPAAKKQPDPRTQQEQEMEAEKPTIEVSLPPPKPPVTRFRQRSVLAMLTAAGFHGATSREMGEYLNITHGQASGALSRLHRRRLVEQVEEERRGQRIYVLPDQVMGRETREYGRSGSPLLNEAIALLVEAHNDADRTLHPDWRERVTALVEKDGKRKR